MEYCYGLKLYSRCTSLRIPIFKLLRISTLFPQYLSFARSIKQVKFGLTRKKEVVFKMNLAWPCMFCDSLGILPVWHSVVEQTSGVVDHHYTFHSYTFIEIFFFFKEFFLFSIKKEKYIQGILDGSYVLFYSFLVDMTI